MRPSLDDRERASCPLPSITAVRSRSSNATRALPSNRARIGPIATVILRDRGSAVAGPVSDAPGRQRTTVATSWRAVQSASGGMARVTSCSDPAAFGAADASRRGGGLNGRSIECCPAPPFRKAASSGGCRSNGWSASSRPAPPDPEPRGGAEERGSGVAKPATPARGGVDDSPVTPSGSAPGAGGPSSTDRTACTIPTYPVHRQRLPESSSRTRASPAPGRRRTTSYAVISIPGVQYPH